MQSASLNEEFRVFAGTANPELAAAVAGELGVRVGIRTIDRFPDGEVAVQLLAHCW
jgi:ribose-phosphate pyrophosphokinase